MISSFLGPVLFAIALGAMFLVVPREKIKDFISLGLLAGFGIAVVLIFVMQNLFGFWQFQNVDFFISGIPVFFSATWIPLIVIYSYLNSIQKQLTSLALIVVIFPLASTLFHYFMVLNQLIIYNNWSLMLTFIVSLVIHIAITGYLYATGKLNRVTV